MRKKLRCVVVLAAMSLMLTACGDEKPENPADAKVTPDALVEITPATSDITFVPEPTEGPVNMPSEAPTEGAMPTESAADTPTEAPVATPTTAATPTPINYTYNDLNKTMYAENDVNVRMAPSTAGTPVGSLKRGTAVTVTGQCVETRWYRIDFNGQIGYVSNNYLIEAMPADPTAAPTKAPAAGNDPAPTKAPASVEMTTSNPIYQGNINIENRDGVYYVNGYLIANKTYSLPSTYVPSGTHVAIGNGKNVQEGIVENVYQEWLKLKSGASSDGIALWIGSGYRSYSFQGELYNNYVQRDGGSTESADKYSARAGHSEHQTGLCFDLNQCGRTFNGTKEAQWVNDNCYKYGFIIRYPSGKEDKTGYNYESWHLRYVGTELAQALYNGGNWITMEEYFGLTSHYHN